MEEQAAPARRQNLGALVALLLVTALLAGYIGYLINNINKPVASPKIPEFNSATPNSMLTIQQEAAVGKITQINGNQAIVQGDKGDSISLKLSSNLKIYNLPSASDSAKLTASQKLSDIVLNQKATLILVPENDVMSVISISYLPNAK